MSFSRDVMAVLSKSGCNSGACHGNLNGKGGFKLSLRGEDWRADYDWLTHESAGRRIDLSSPDQSLVLLKATGRIAHQGGTRFRSDSREYQVFRDWIGAGAPSPAKEESPLVRLEVTPLEQVVISNQIDSITIQAMAIFADGSRREVTPLATYETSNLKVQVSPQGVVRRESFGEATVIVRYLNLQVPVSLAFVPERADFVWNEPPAENLIDAIVNQRLQTMRIQPSDQAEDHVFVRRVCLDVLGVLPTLEEAQEFVGDSRPDKRQRFIDALLARSEFADLWALRWADVLRNEEKVLDPKGVDVFHGWIRSSMAEGKPIDRFVRDLLRATGSTYEQPAANFWRANRDPTTRAESVARLFLGARLQCARCHNHPFDRWTQDDYYSWSAIFARLDYDIVKNERKDKFDKNEFVGEQIVKISDGGGVEHPRTRQLASAKLLGADELGPGSYDDRLTPLAVWLTAPDNRMFSRAMVNFVWFHLIGRGLVDPIDDLRSTNPAVSEKLLNSLADEFVRRSFDLQWLVRSILNSRTYQRSAVPNGTNRDDPSGLSRALIVRLSAEKLLDAQSQLLDWPAEFNGFDRGIRAGQLPGVRRGREKDRSAGGGDRFLKMFGKPERLLACECERSNETSLNQAFVLIGSEEVQRRLMADGNRLDRLARSHSEVTQLVDELYWIALARSPSVAEREAAEQLFSHQVEGADTVTTRLVALQDLTWALMNAKEFLFRW